MPETTQPTTEDLLEIPSEGAAPEEAGSTETPKTESDENESEPEA